MSAVTSNCDVIAHVSAITSNCDVMAHVSTITSICDVMAHKKCAHFIRLTATIDLR